MGRGLQEAGRLAVTAAQLVMALLAALHPEAAMLFAAAIFLLVPCCKPSPEAVVRVRAPLALLVTSVSTCVLFTVLCVEVLGVCGESNPLYCRLGPPTFYATVLVSRLALAVPIVQLETVALSLEPRSREYVEPMARGLAWTLAALVAVNAVHDACTTLTPQYSPVTYAALNAVYDSPLIAASALALTYAYLLHRELKER